MTAASAVNPYVNYVMCYIVIISDVPELNHNFPSTSRGIFCHGPQEIQPIIAQGIESKNNANIPIAAISLPEG